ncbi:MAG TPA: YidC/Oxa1 family membrane protein insertase [Pelolinea sp.]|nr:YidC/Oxa1 family membrane protein insertase [Pelolinea sp.]
MWDTIIIKPFISILLFIYDLIGQNFGLAIILFTIIIKAVTYPLTAKQIKSSKALQDLQKDKEWQDIQKKYKNDRDRLAQEQMKLYRDKGISPFASCLPTVIQFPIIIGLYQSIIQTMGNAPLQMLNLVSKLSPWLANIFSFIPGLKEPINLIPLNSQFLWMDIGRPERVFIPGISFGIPVLALFVVITSFLQTKLIGSPTGDQQQGQMSGIMNLYLPLLMGWFAYSFASGLALYFVASNLITIAQYAFMGKASFANLFPKKSSEVKKSGKG